MYPVSRFVFHKNQVIYCSVVDGDAYFSFHNRTGLTDQQAKGCFHLEHSREVETMIHEKKVKEAQQNRGKLIAV